MKRRKRRRKSRWKAALYALPPMLLGALIVVIAAQALGSVSAVRGPHDIIIPGLGVSVAAATAAAPTATSVPHLAGAPVAVPIASAGCGHAPAIAPGTSAEETLSSGGLTRAYRLHIPPGYSSILGAALVVDFHGSGSTDAMFETYSGQSTDADRDGFLVAYPQGLVGSNGRTGWGGVGIGQPQVDDVLFASDVLNAIQGAYCVDPRRIYVMGYSRGGGMAALLACRLAERVAAYAIVSGTYLQSVESGCAPTRAVPILEFHGSADTTVPYQGGGSTDDFLPVPQWLHDWVTRDGCVTGPTTFYQADGVTGEEWSGCTGNALVAHYLIDGGSHEWPHGDGGVHLLDATTTAWNFFQAHPLP